MKLQEMNKEEFLQSEFGQALQECAVAYDRRLEQMGDPVRSRKVREQRKDFSKAQMKVYIQALKHIYGIDFKFITTCQYYGVATADGKDWLFFVQREGILDNCPYFLGSSAESRFCRAVMRDIRAMQQRYHSPAKIENSINILKRVCMERGVSKENMELLFGGGDDTRD